MAQDEKRGQVIQGPDRGPRAQDRPPLVVLLWPNCCVGL